MKTLNVVAAAILRRLPDNRTELFIAERSYGDLAGCFEFPGGKIEPGELPEAAIKREIREELETEVEVGRLLTTVDYDYPTFHLHMYVFQCEVVNGSLTLKEHKSALWVTCEQIDSVRFAPADRQVADEIKGAIWCE